MRNAIRGWLMTWIVAAGCLGAVSARAVGPEVRDNAGLFSAEAVKQADESIRKIQRDFRKELLVETFAGVPEGRTNEYARNREEFFASIVRERAQAARLDGIYVLVMKEPPPRRFRIQVGVGQATRQRAFTTANRDELVRTFQSSFRTDKYDEGLRSSVAYVERTLQSNLSAVAPAASGARAVSGTSTEQSAPARRLPSVSSSSLSLAPLMFTGLLIVGGVFVVVLLLRALRGGMGRGGVAPGQPGWTGGGGGGFFSSLLGSIGGVMAGSWLYDHFFNSNAHASGSPPLNPTEAPFQSDAGGDFTSAGGDVGGGDFGSSGGDVGGGGDAGGGGFDGGGGDGGGGGDA